MKELLLIVIAYMIGSIPTSVWVSRYFFGVDIRDYGSGNAGATNTYRVLGAKWGTFVMVVDMLKGVMAASLFLLLPITYLGSDHELHRTNFQIALGMAAILGHIFPIWADFKGGKGVATVFGMVLAIQPMVAVCCVAVFIAVLFLTRFVSLSSILASIAFPIFLLLIFREQVPLYRVFAIAVALLVILTHQKNINKLLNGNESKARILKYRDRRRNRRNW